MNFAKKQIKYCGTALSIIILTSFIMIILIMASVPPVSRDALTHHLAVPKLFLTHGFMYENPSMSFLYYPMNIDLLYMIPLYFNNDIIPKYLHFLLGLLTAWFIYRYLREYAGRLYGFIGAMLFLSIPVIIKLSVTVYVDLGLVLFSWLSLYFVIKWKAHQFQARYLVYAAVSCGLALGTKYNGLLLLFIMAGMIPLMYSIEKNAMIQANHLQRNRNSLQGVFYGLLFMGVALIIFSPWMVRNYVLMHNPVYPLYDSWFNASPGEEANMDLSKGYSSRLNHFQKRRYVYHESLLQSILMPIRIFFQGQDDNPKYFDGKLNPFLFILPFFAFFIRRRKNDPEHSHRIIFVSFVMLYLLIALFTTDMRIRYIAPIIPPLVILTVLGFKRLMEAPQNPVPLKKILAISMIGGAFIFNGKYLIEQFQYINPLDYITGKINREEYITQYRPDYAVIQYANQVLPNDAKVLCLLIGNRTYYLDREYHFCDDFFQRNKLGKYEESDIIKRLSRYGTTHVIFGLETYRRWHMDNLNEAEQKLFSTVLENHTRILYEKFGYQLLEVNGI